MKEHKPKRSTVEDEIDDLFKLSLSEFTDARNKLGARLKKDGNANEAARVKALSKPSVSAWAVNQLYWQHREDFDRLLSAGNRFRQAQTSRSASKVAAIRESLEARREELSNLANLAEEILAGAGHNPSLETIRRVTTTLEAMSAYASVPDAPAPGRLTHDVDPPGFDSFATLIPRAGVSLRPASPAVSPKPDNAKTRAKTSTADNVKERKAAHQKRLSAAKSEVQAAKRTLNQAITKVKSLEAAQKKAQADVKEAEKQKLQAEQRLKKVNLGVENATRRARSVTGELKEAKSTAESAQKSVEEATKELEALFREAP